MAAKSKECFWRHGPWIKVSETYTPPYPSKTDRIEGRELTMAMSLGLTVATMRCAECGVLRYQTTPGRATSENN